MSRRSFVVACVVQAMACSASDSPSGPSSDANAVNQCEPRDPEPELLTDDLGLINHVGGPICRGTLVALDRELQRLSELMNLPLESPLYVDYGDDAVLEHCDVVGQSAAGCVSGFECETRVATSFVPQVHELVHAIRRRNGLDGPAIIEEGLAVVLGDHRPLRGQAIGVSHLDRQSMVELLEVTREEFTRSHYTYGGHFISFLMIGFGEGTTIDLLSDGRYPDDLSELFEEYLGVTLEQVDERWQDEAWETSYTVPPPCAEFGPLGDGFESSATFDCDGDDTLGHEGMRLYAQPRGCFTLPEPTPVSIVIAGEGADVSVISYDCEPEDEADPEIETRGYRLPGGSETESILGRCIWQIEFSKPWSIDVTEHSVAIRPLPE